MFASRLFGLAPLCSMLAVGACVTSGTNSDEPATTTPATSAAASEADDVDDGSNNNSDDGSMSNSTVNNALVAALKAGAPVVDVRNPEEWAEGHRAGAILLPLPTFGEHLADVDALVDGDRTRTVVVVCRSGRRAGQAKVLLEAAGYTNVVNGGGWDTLPTTP